MAAPNFRLDGRVALVSGAGRGIDSWTTIEPLVAEFATVIKRWLRYLRHGYKWISARALT